MNIPHISFEASDFPNEEGKCEKSMSLLTESQAAALTLLCSFYDLQRFQFETCIQPRLKALVVGPSGFGKTAAIRAFSERNDLPLLSIPTGAWSVYNAKSENYTICAIRNFVRANETGCIYYDEIDKCCPHDIGAYKSDWALSVFTEVLTLLDADDRLLSFNWLPEDIEKFKATFFTVASGAWQHLASENPQESSNPVPSHAQRVAATSGIPTEIVRRFNPRFIVIEPPTKNDFRNFISKIHRDLDLPQLEEEKLVALTQHAVSSHHGVRWLESYLVNLLISHPHLPRRTRSQSRSNEKSKPLTITHAKYREHLERLYNHLRQGSVETALLQKKLSLAAKSTQDTGLTGILLTEGLKTGLINQLVELKPLFSYELTHESERTDLVGMVSNELEKVLAGLTILLTDYPEFLSRSKILDATIRLEVLLRDVSNIFHFLARVEIQEVRNGNY